VDAVVLAWRRDRRVERRRGLGAVGIGRRHEVACFESLLFGRNFGLVTDVSTGPDGHLSRRVDHARSGVRDLRRR
jgi:hypothetical protein